MTPPARGMTEAMGKADRWVIAYAGPHDGQGLGRERIAEVLEAARCWAPPERTLVVVQEAERPWWSILAAAFPPANVLPEPFDRGSGTGVLGALVALAGWAPDAEVAVVFGAIPAAVMGAAERALLSSPCPEDLAVFRPSGGTATPWPLAVCTVPGWLVRADAVDRARLESLRMAMARATHPGEAFAELYPYLTSLDLREALLEGPLPRRVVTLARPASVPSTVHRLNAAVLPA